MFTAHLGETEEDYSALGLFIADLKTILMSLNTIGGPLFSSLFVHLITYWTKASMKEIALQ